MKKIAGILMAVILVGSLSACGKAETKPSKNTSTVKSVDDVLMEQAGKDAADAGKVNAVDNEAAKEDAMESVNKKLEEAANEAENNSSSADGIDIDLTKLSSTLIYSEVYNMMADPEKYMGKKIRMSGNTAIYHDENDGNDYYACIIKDATACCAQGIEFQLKDRSYPAEDAEITVSGIFSSYDIEGAIFYTLKDAVLE